MLAALSGSCQYIIVCDASGLGVCNVLLQEQEDRVVLLEFKSKKFSSAERNWDTRD